MLHLKEILNYLVEGNRTITNSYQFVDLIDFFDWEHTDRLLSFDIESLYTRVPVPEALKIVHQKLEKWVEDDELDEWNPDGTIWNSTSLKEVTSLTVKGIMSLLDYVLSDVFFVYDDRLYHQRTGLPMGGHLLPVLASLFMENLEDQALKTYPISPRFYVRFVDDLFLIWDISKGDFKELLKHLNNQNEAINVTFKEEVDASLPFLDLMIRRPVVSPCRQQCQEYSISIYRKLMHAHRYLNFKSAVPKVLKRNTFRSQWLKGQRLLRRHPGELGKEIDYLRGTYSSQGNTYPIGHLQRWLLEFQMELEENPAILRLPAKSKR